MVVLFFLFLNCRDVACYVWLRLYATSERNVCTLRLYTTSVKNKKSRPISRILLTLNLFQCHLIIYLDQQLLIGSSFLPFDNGRVILIPTARESIYLKFHRIEFTWFHYSLTCTYFLLHLSFSVPKLRDGTTDVIRYATLWCPDFPTRPKRRVDKAVCGAKVNIKNTIYEIRSRKFMIWELF